MKCISHKHSLKCFYPANERPVDGSAQKASRKNQWHLEAPAALLPSKLSLLQVYNHTDNTYQSHYYGLNALAHHTSVSSGIKPKIQRRPSENRKNSAKRQPKNKLSPRERQISLFWRFVLIYCTNGSPEFLKSAWTLWAADGGAL